MKFLDYAGLKLFWEKCRQYIQGYVDASCGEIAGAAAEAVEASAANAAAIADLCSGAGENLLPGTNKGVSGWTAIHSDNGKMLLQSVSDGKTLKVTNYMDTATPGWQTLTRSVPAGILAKGEKCVLSFKAIAATGDNAMCLFASVGDSASTRTVAQSEWFYIEAGKEVSCSVVLEGLIDGGSISADLLKLGIVSGQNGGWKELAIWDVQLERGSTPTAYRPAPADTLARIESLEHDLGDAQHQADLNLERINELEARLSESITEIGEYINQTHCGAQICVLADIDNIDMIYAVDYQLGSFVFDDSRGVVYEVYNDGDDYLFEDVNQWNDRSRGWKARTDVLFYYSKTFFTVNDSGDMDQSPKKVPFTPLALTNHELKTLSA